MTSAMTRLPDPTLRPEFYSGVPLKRGLAWIIDSVLVGIATAIIVPFTAFIGLFFLPVLFLFVGFLYRWVTIASGSATFGMQFAAIELRDREGQRLAGDTAFLHTAGYTFSMAVFPLQLISIALMLTSGRGQGLTDHILGTAAIHRTV